MHVIIINTWTNNSKASVLTCLVHIFIAQCTHAVEQSSDHSNWEDISSLINVSTRDIPLHFPQKTTKQAPEGMHRLRTYHSAMHLPRTYHPYIFPTTPTTNRTTPPYTAPFNTHHHPQLSPPLTIPQPPSHPHPQRLNTSQNNTPHYKLTQTSTAPLYSAKPRINPFCLNLIAEYEANRNH